MAKKPTSTATPAIAAENDVNTVMINPELIGFNDEFNGRYKSVTQEVIEKLAWSMLKIGQMQAIEINPIKSNDGGITQYTLTAGFTRLKAALLIRKGFKGEDGKIHSKPDFLIRATIRVSKPIEQLRRNIRENSDRTDVTPMCYAKNIKRLIEAGDTTTEIAKLFGWDQPKVSRFNSLNLLPEDIQDMVYAGTITATVACEIAKKANKFTHEQITDLLKQTNGSPTMQAVNDYIRNRDKATPKGDSKANPVTDTSLPASHINPANVPDDNDDSNKGSTRAISRSFSQTKEFIESYIGPGSNQITCGIMAAILGYMKGTYSENEADAVIRVLEKEISDKGIGTQGMMRERDKK